MRASKQRNDFSDCIMMILTISEVGSGFKQSMRILDAEEFQLSFIRYRGAYEAALKYSNERIQFGKPISHFAISFKLAEMATENEAADLLIRSASLKLIARSLLP